MRYMTSSAPLGLDRSVFISKRSLLVRVTFNAGRVGAGGEARLLCVKATVRIMTIAAPHRAFEHFVMEGHRELRLHFLVATGAELWIVGLQHSDS